MKALRPSTKSIALIGTLSLIAFVVLLNADKGYLSTAELIAIPRNSAMAQNPEATVGDIRRIILSRPFSRQIDDRVAEIAGTEDASSSAQAKAWAETVRIEPEKGSHAFLISVFEKDADGAQEINEAVIRNLVSAFGTYYDIRNELDLRIIEQPLAVPANRTGLAGIISLSLLCGILAYVLAFVAIPRIYFEKKDPSSEDESGRFPAWKKISFNFPKRTPEASEADEPYSFPEEPIADIQPEPEFAEESIAAETGTVETFLDEKEGMPEEQTGHERKSGSPDNLPTMDEIPDFVLKAASQAQPESETETEKPVMTKEKKPDASREASPDEVKARLNRLLSGEL